MLFWYREESSIFLEHTVRIVQQKLSQSNSDVLTMPKFQEVVSRNMFLDEGSRQIVEVQNAKVWKFVGSLLLLLGEGMVVPFIGIK